MSAGGGLRPGLQGHPGLGLHTLASPRLGPRRANTEGGGFKS